MSAFGTSIDWPRNHSGFAIEANQSRLWQPILKYSVEGELRWNNSMAESAFQSPDGKKIPLPVYAMLVLTIIGIADAAYVAHGNYAGAQLWCPILDGCNAVINSPYSRVFGMPMSYFGFIYYLFMFGLAARLAYEPSSKILRFRAILYAALGAISSIYFIYLQLGFIHEICSYCLISAATSFLLLFAALWHFQTTRQAAIK
jgi:uncharacterized membrane protein